ncbi:MAG: corrinoid protein [Candidatus Methanomethylicia archaeon]
MSTNLVNELREAVLSYDLDTLINAVKKSLEKGVSAIDVINALTVVLREVGDKFQAGSLFLAELVAIAENVKTAISEVLEPELKKIGGERKSLGKVVIGTVHGDIHDIGKNIVASMLFAAGFEVYDLGKDVPVEEFVGKAREVNADIIAMSALLSTTLPVQREVIERLSREGLKEKIKVMVGGAPVTKEWAEEIGADGYGEDAIEAVRVAKTLSGVRE